MIGWTSHAVPLQLAAPVAFGTSNVGVTPPTTTPFFNAFVLRQTSQADPTQLPVASGQSPNIAAYSSLIVPAQAAGYSYLDPTTGVKVWKVSPPSEDTATICVARLKAQSLTAPLGQISAQVLLAVTGSVW